MNVQLGSIVAIATPSAPTLLDPIPAPAHTPSLETEEIVDFPLVSSKLPTRATVPQKIMGPNLTPVHPRSQGLFPTPPGNEDDSCFSKKNYKLKTCNKHPTQQGK